MRVIRYGNHMEYQRELTGAARYYTGNNIYAYPFLTGLESGHAEIVNIETGTRRERLEQRLLFVNVNDSIDLSNVPSNVIVVKYDGRKYASEYSEKHDEWLAEKRRNDPDGYDDCDDLE